MIRDIHQKLGLMHGLHTMWYLLNKQINGYDCGMHVIWNTYCLSMGHPLTPIPCESMAFRVKLARGLLNKRFNDLLE